MDCKDDEFMRELFRGLAKRGEDLDKEIVMSQRMLLNAIRTFYEIKLDKTLKTRALHLSREGMFNVTGGGFLLTDRAKRSYGGLTSEPKKVNGDDRFI